MRVGLLGLAAVVVGCAHPTFNDGNKVVLKYTPLVVYREQLQTKADEACRAHGKAGAVFVTDVSMHPGMDWLGPDRLATFDCK